MCFEVVEHNRTCDWLTYTCACLNEQCGYRLKEEMKKQRVFLTIDNVVDSSESLKEASVYIQAEYGNGSVIVVTARSIDQLQMVNINKRDCLENARVG